MISWSSKKQQVVARLSAESKYRALAHVACELKWITSLLQELQVSLVHPTITWCDNISAAALACNPIVQARTKHIEIDVHFIREQVLRKQLEVRYVPSHEQLANCLTKPLSLSRFQFLHDKLGLIVVVPRLTGEVKAQSLSSSLVVLS